MKKEQTLTLKRFNIKRMLSKQNEEKLYKRVNNLIKKYNLIDQSPYSDSFYDSFEIGWGYKPEGSLRLSDHWNFVSRDEKHCELDYTDKYVNEWLLCRYENGKYTVVERVFNDEEQALENRMRERIRARLNKKVKAC